MKKTPLILLFCLLAAHLAANDLLHDIVGGKYKPVPAPMMTLAEDGQHYYQLKGDSLIVRYDLKSGNATDTVFDRKRTQMNEMESIEGFVMGPGERFLLVYNNSEKIYRHSFKADYYLYEVARKELRPLAPEGQVTATAFSPNGRYIAFSRQNNLYVYKIDFHSTVSVTTDGEAGKIINGTPDWLYEEEFSCRQLFEWSADSKQLAFVRFDETYVKMFDFQFFMPESFTADEMLLYPRNFTYKYPKAGETNAKVSVCVYDTYYKTVKTMQVEAENCYIPRIRWTGQPDQLAIFRLNRNQNKLDMFYANPKSTVCTAMYTEQDERYVDFLQIDEWQFLSDGSFMAVNETDGYRHIHLYDRNGLHKKQLTKGNWDVTACYGLDAKKNVAYFQAADRSPMTRNIYSVALKNGKIQPLTPEEGTHNAVFAPGFSYFIDTYSSLQTPTRVTLCTAGNGKLVRVLHDNRAVQEAFESLNLPVKEFFTFQTPEGVELNGWMVKPADMEQGKKYPLLQVQYSGPNSQQVLNQWKKDWEYCLAAEGYVVACVDGRGTGARGSEFRKCTYRNIGQYETADQLSAARYLGTLPFVDGQRMAIWGWSFGGYMALMCLSADEPVFKAGISIAPVTDWRFYNTAYTERYMRRPQENFAGYDAGSPLLRADKLNGSLLLVHGTADDNVHVQNAYNYVHRLVEAGKQFEMQIYPDENHFIRKGNSLIHLYDRMKIFLDKNL